MSDSPLHSGIGTDRLLVVWKIASERVALRLGTSATAAEPVGADAPLVNPVTDSAEGPVSSEPASFRDAARVRIAVPAELQELKRRSLPLAQDWRRKTRAAFERAFAEGFEVRDFLRGARFGYYVLEKTTLRF
jgi:predicted GNAT superfamily acetyltransferase